MADYDEDAEGEGGDEGAVMGDDYEGEEGGEGDYDEEGGGEEEGDEGDEEGAEGEEGQEDRDGGEDGAKASAPSAPAGGPAAMRAEKARPVQLACCCIRVADTLAGSPFPSPHNRPASARPRVPPRRSSRSRR